MPIGPDIPAGGTPIVQTHGVGLPPRRTLDGSNAGNYPEHLTTTDDVEVTAVYQW